MKLLPLFLLSFALLVGCVDKGEQTQKPVIQSVEHEEKQVSLDDLVPRIKIADGIDLPKTGESRDDIIDRYGPPDGEIHLEREPAPSASWSVGDYRVQILWRGETCGWIQYKKTQGQLSDKEVEDLLSLNGFDRDKTETKFGVSNSRSSKSWREQDKHASMMSWSHGEQAQNVLTVVTTEFFRIRSSYQMNQRNSLSGFPAKITENFLPLDEANDSGSRSDGVLQRTYSSGQKQYEAHYVDGKQHGLETWWYKGGQKLYETQFIHGRKHGLATCWNGEHQKIWEVRYENDRVVERIK